MTAQFLRADTLLSGWRDDVVSGTPPVRYPVGTGALAEVQIGPGLVTLLGGAPGAGKSAFAMQCAIDALRMTPTLRAVICNVEMPPAVMLDRQLARLSGVDLTLIHRRQLEAEHSEWIERGIQTLESIGERLNFLRPPFNLQNVAETVDATESGLVVLDYIQRIPPPGEQGDRRGSIDRTMDFLRQFADADMAVLVVAAVARSKDSRGRATYAGDVLNLASFRESSELEFGADDAYMFTPEEDGYVLLRHLKSRYGAATGLLLRFNPRLQRFTSPNSVNPPDQQGGNPDVAALWRGTSTANDELGEHGA